MPGSLGAEQAEESSHSVYHLMTRLCVWPTTQVTGAKDLVVFMSLMGTRTVGPLGQASAGRADDLKIW